MVDRQAQYGQDPNRIVDVNTFLGIGQSLRELERLIDSFGRTLTDNERRLQQTLPGMIKTFDRIEKEYSSGNGKLSKSQAADLKVMIANEKNILKWLDELSRFNPKTGLALNERGDQSFIHYASIFEDVMEKLTNSMQRSYKKWDAYNKDIDKVRQAYGLLPASARISHIAPASPIPQIPKNKGIVDASTFGYAYIRKKEQEEFASMTDPYTALMQRLRKKSKLGTASATQTAVNILRKKFNVPQKNVGYGTPPPNQTSGAPLTGAGRYAGFQRGGPAIYPPRPTAAHNWNRRLTFFGKNTGFFQNIHKALGTLPIIGSITGLTSRMSSGGNAMNNAGKILEKNFSSTSFLGKVGKLLAGPIGIAIGATAVAVGAIYKQLKKSSPVLQAVTDIMELAWNLMWMPFGNALGQYLIPLAEDMINFAILFNELFTDFSLDKLVEVYYTGLQMIWGMLFDVGNVITSFVVDGIFSLFSDFFRSIGLDGIADYFDAIKNAIHTIRDFIRNLPSHIYEGLKNILPLLKEAFSTIIKSMPGGDMLEAATNGDVVSAGKSVWNNTIGNWTGFKLATGGVVTSPTIAMVGEAGPEAVIPLDKAGGIGATYVININGDVYGVSDLESRIERVIQRTANKSYYR